jgi:hypothetical protein
MAAWQAIEIVIFRCGYIWPDGARCHRKVFAAFLDENGEAEPLSASGLMPASSWEQIRDEGRTGKWNKVCPARGCRRARNYELTRETLRRLLLQARADGESVVYLHDQLLRRS